MKQYRSIPKQVIKSQQVYMFDKLDGSNIRVEWTKKNGFDKFGSRKRLLGSDQPIMGKAKDLIADFDGIEDIFIKNKWQKVTLFFEFVGPNSFAGTHVEGDDFKLYLIDVNPYKKGILPPREFLKLFSSFRIPKLLYTGNITDEIEQSIRSGTFDGVTDEGVVCKYIKKNQWRAFKIKSDSWLTRLKAKCDAESLSFEDLS